MKDLTEEDLKAAFETGEQYERSGYDYIYSFEDFMDVRFCVDRNGHDWVDNAKDIGRFFCSKCGRYK